MARPWGCGSFNPRPSARNPQPAPPRPRITAMLRYRPICLLLVVVGLVLTYPGVLLQAQNTMDDVHIRPRVDVHPPGEQALLNPSLKPHERPLKVNVDLVLVPVTITDPMNRLVTGLDKDNFAVFEGKNQQEIRSFSSEDAPVSL